MHAQTAWEKVSICGPCLGVVSLSRQSKSNISNDHFFTLARAGRFASCSAQKNEKEWKVVVGRMSLVEVTLMLHAIEQLIQYSGPRCRYTGNLYTVISVIGKAPSCFHLSV